MPFSGLDIYKLLPKTNCRECGFATCLAFAMQLAKKAIGIEKCPYVSPEAKATLEASSLPPIRLISIGVGENKLEIGNETVLFRHEEKFHRPCGIGFIVEDGLTDNEIKEKIVKINQLHFERVGQELRVNLVALKSANGQKRYLEALQTVLANTQLPLVLMNSDVPTLEAALAMCAEKKPLVYAATKTNVAGMLGLAQKFKVPLVVAEFDAVDLAQLTQELSSRGVQDLVLDTGTKSISDKIWDLTQIRRQALKKSNRSLGYPVLAIAENNCPYTEAIAASTYIVKYAGIVLIEGIESWEILSLLTLRQNIYTDPQKPLQIEPKVYSIGKTTTNSPLLVTTNFSLTYYTVLGEVEASKVPAHIMSVDTEGMSVLTAWAAEKFNAEKVTASISKFQAESLVSHKKMVIPGYVAMMSGDLEEQSGWRVIVGPKEAAGIPAFLKNL